MADGVRMADKARTSRIARIHCVAKELGFVGNNKDLLYMQVEIATGKNSISQLTIPQLQSVLKQLDSILATKRRSQTRGINATSNVILLPTPDQREHAARILVELREPLGIRNPDAYLTGVAKKSCGKSLDQLNRIEFAQIIEALKKIRSRF